MDRKEYKNGVIINNDCLVAMDNLIENRVKIDCCITDLPYQKTKNKWDITIPFDEMWKRLDKLVKPDGAIILFGQDTFTAKLMLSNEKNHRYNLVWDKVLTSGFLNANRMPMRQHEDICVFYKKLPTYNPQKTLGDKPAHSSGNKSSSEYQNRNYGKFENVDNSKAHGNMKFPTSIVRFEKPHPSICIHATQKSLSLIEWLIKTYSNESELILDFTAGSCTLAEGCINTNRKFICIEKDIDIYNVGVKRIDEVVNNI